MNEYFSHDYRARSDPKLVKVMMHHGLLGIGAYWCIIEMLYENGGYILQTEYERIAYELRTEKKLIKSIIEDFQLFSIKQKKFYSLTVLNRLKKRLEKSEKARQSVTVRWGKNEPNTNSIRSDTNVSQMLNDSNTYKNKKEEKENKENIISSHFESEKQNPIIPYFEKKEKSSAKKERNIIPPTIAMVTQYCDTRNNGICPQSFLDHYAAKGWMIGKEKMIDWQAAIRTWEQKNKFQTQRSMIKPKKYGNT